ncbi:MAG: metal-sensing transcriptional repressor [Candidatus Moranbacteria bacterium]|nr:metal-sensing transcriptional repressor [Candidatus Moranbacteria bacterium]
MQDKEIITALKKASTHLSNVIKMIEDGEYCVSIMQQNLAVVGLLKSANDKLLARHLSSCFMNAMKGTNEKRKQEMIDEILQLNKMSK